LEIFAGSGQRKRFGIEKWSGIKYNKRKCKDKLRADAFLALNRFREGDLKAFRMGDSSDNIQPVKG
jgi:hypothetical protein